MTKIISGDIQPMEINKFVQSKLMIQIEIHRNQQPTTLTYKLKTQILHKILI